MAANVKTTIEYIHCWLVTHWGRHMRFFEKSFQNNLISKYLSIRKLQTLKLLEKPSELVKFGISGYCLWRLN